VSADVIVTSGIVNFKKNGQKVAICWQTLQISNRIPTHLRKVPTEEIMCTESLIFTLTVSKNECFAPNFYFLEQKFSNNFLTAKNSWMGKQLPFAFFPCHDAPGVVTA